MNSADRCVNEEVPYLLGTWQAEADPAPQAVDRNPWPSGF